MPRLPSFKTSSLRALFEQLRYAPMGSRERILAAAEQLSREIEEDRAYPEEFITYRLTGFRPDASGESPQLVGGAVLADLGAFVQALTAEMALPPVSEQRGRALALNDAAQRIQVTVRTLRRYRNRGLLLHFVVFDDDVRLACYDQSLQWFEERHPGVVRRASGFSRVDDADAGRMIRRAQELAADGVSRQHAAGLIAEEFGRAAETIRGLIATAERRGQLTFRHKRQLRARERELIHRASRLGTSRAQIARHLGVTPLTVRRTLIDRRIHRIAGMDLAGPVAPTFDRDEADEVLLSPEFVREGLGPPPRGWNALELIGTVVEVPDDDRMLAMITAYYYLKFRAKRVLSDLPSRPAEASVDNIETDLRWAAMIKRSLVFRLLPSAIVRVNTHLGRRLIDVGRDEVMRFLQLVIDDLSRSLEQIDPARDQRINRRVLFQLEKTLSMHSSDQADTRARARHAGAQLQVGDPFAELCPWQTWAELSVQEVDRVDSLPDDVAAFVSLRWGLDGTRPRTLHEISKELSLSRRAGSNILRMALRSLRLGPAV